MSYAKYMDVETPFGGKNAKAVQASNDGFLKKVLQTLLESYDRNFNTVEPGSWGFMQ